MYYVYVDYTIDGRPFYVGKGNLKRTKNLKRGQRRIGHRPTHSDVVANHGQVRTIVLSQVSEDGAFSVEIGLIAKLHTCVWDTKADNIACNQTLGGDGIA